MPGDIEDTGSFRPAPVCIVHFNKRRYQTWTTCRCWSTEGGWMKMPDHSMMMTAMMFCSVDPCPCPCLGPDHGLCPWTMAPSLHGLLTFRVLEPSLSPSCDAALSCRHRSQRQASDTQGGADVQPAPKHKNGCPGGSSCTNLRSTIMRYRFLRYAEIENRVSSSIDMRIGCGQTGSSSVDIGPE